MLTVPLRLLVLDSEQSPSALFKSLKEAHSSTFVMMPWKSRVDSQWEIREMTCNKIEGDENISKDFVINYFN
jgi:hypothetical protein